MTTTTAAVRSAARTRDGMGVGFPAWRDALGAIAAK